MKPMIGVLAVMAVALAGCDEMAPTPTALPAPTSSLVPSAETDGPAAEVVRDAFRLTIRTASHGYRADEPIDVSTVLAYAGPAQRVEVAGSGSGIVIFAIEQLDGPIRIEGGGSADCHPWTIPRGENAVPFSKSGGYSTDDPLADFYARYFDDPALRLPAGRWRITALANFYPPGCEGEGIRMAASVEVTVE